jgi:hypothetical protein
VKLWQSQRTGLSEAKEFSANNLVAAVGLPLHAGQNRTVIMDDPEISFVCRCVGDAVGDENGRYIATPDAVELFEFQC